MEKTAPGETGFDEGGLNRGEPETEEIEIENSCEEGKDLQSDKCAHVQVSELWPAEVAT